MNSPKIFLEDSDMIDEVGHIFQIDIDNTDTGCVDQRLRIGSKAGLKDSYKSLVLTPAACDNEVIKDQFGIGCKAAQRLSNISLIGDGLIVRKIYIFSESLTQLNQRFLHHKILDTLELETRSNNIAFTKEKTDIPSTRNIAMGKWELKKDMFLEFVALANCKLSIVMIYMSVAEILTLGKQKQN